MVQAVMDFTRLRTLRELANRRTMAAVAEALYLTPSAVSQQIAQLEEEAGVALTERQGRRVKLTHAGELLVTHVERMLTVLDEAKSDLAVIREEISGTLRIAAFATAAATLLPPVIQALRRPFPRLQVTLAEMEPAEGLAALGSWDANLAIVDDLSLQLARLEKTVETVPLLEDELRVVMTRGHRLAERESIDLTELQDEDWALDSAGSFYGEFVTGLCRRAGYTPRVNAECQGSEIIAAMVASGCSISIIPALRIHQMPASLVTVSLRPRIKRKILAVFRRGDKRHPTIQAFLQELKRAAELH